MKIRKNVGWDVWDSHPLFLLSHSYFSSVCVNRVGRPFPKGNICTFQTSCVRKDGDRETERESSAMRNPSQDEKRTAAAQNSTPSAIIQTSCPQSAVKSQLPARCVRCSHLHSTQERQQEVEQRGTTTYVCLTRPYNLTFSTSISNRLPFSLLPLDTHGFIYTHAYSNEHIWFCFANSVANDLTTPYKVCLVPLILSWKMKTHTHRKSSLASLCLVRWDDRRSWKGHWRKIWKQERKKNLT